MEEAAVTPQPTTFAHIIKHFLKKGGINVLFRLTPPLMFGLETYFTAVANRALPGSLAALGLAHPIRHFFTHTPGSFFNLLPQKFADAKKIGESDGLPNFNNEHTANLWFAGQLAGLAMDVPTILAMVWTGDFLKLCGVDPVACDKLTAFLRALAIAYPTIQAFSVNRQFIYSPCGDENGMKEKYVLPLIGLAEAGFYIFFAYGLIEGKLGFDIRGLQGSGYAFSLSNTVALLGSLVLLFGSPNLRKYLLHKPNLSLIKKYFLEIFKDGFPVMSRFVMENLSLISMALIAIAISQNQLSALQICNTLLLPITSLAFSFISGIKSEIMLTDPVLVKKVFTLTALPTAFALLLLPFYAGIPKQLSSWFLSGHTPDNQRAIEDINQKALPLLASTEIINTVIHGQRAVLQKAKDLWYPTGTTFLFLCAAFIPAAYAFGKALRYGVPGMSTTYLICMFAVLLAMTARFGYVLKNPAKNAIGCLNPKRCWAMIFGNSESVSLLHGQQKNIQSETLLKNEK